jgi:hypothetical protein
MPHLLPRLRARLAAEACEVEIVDVVQTVPAPSAAKRVLLRACRSGAIAGAARVGRRWVASRAAIDVWLRAHGPRFVEPERDGDALERMRTRFARGRTRAG